MQNVVGTDEYRYAYINYCRIHVSIKHFNFNFECIEYYRVAIVLHACTNGNSMYDSNTQYNICIT